MSSMNRYRIAPVVLLAGLVLIVACVSTQALQTTATPSATIRPTHLPLGWELTAGTPRPRHLTSTASYVTQQAYLAEIATARYYGTPTVQARQTEICQSQEALAAVISPLDLESGYLLDWPVPTITLEQVSEVQSCDLTLAITLNPQSACDWATIAAAFAAGIPPGDLPPEMGRQAFAQAVLLNPAFAFADPLFYGYFDTVRLVEPPPVANRSAVIVLLTLWFGDYEGEFDEPGNYTILITNADSAPQVSVRVASNQDVDYTGLYGHPGGLTSSTFTASVPVESVQALLGGLSDLIPISPGRDYFDLSFSFPRCQEREPAPHWGATFYFSDHSRFIMQNFGSAYLVDGGPWVTIIDNQYYLQYSSAFLLALSDLADALDLPLVPIDTTLVTQTGCDFGPYQLPSIFNAMFYDLLFES